MLDVNVDGEDVNEVFTLTMLSLTFFYCTGYFDFDLILRFRKVSPMNYVLLREWFRIAFVILF